MEFRQYRLQFQEAKQHEHKSWVDNDVYDLMDMNKHPARNFVKGRWALILKRDKDGKFQKCKARWVLKGFQDKQKWINKLTLPRRQDQVFGWRVNQSQLGSCP